jgi:F0F1-type ATP synthase membrane subunit c/vacuolar-type H+-ATPase subunit K
VTFIDPVRIQEHVHGHIGWLAAIALIHPAVVLRRPKRKAHLAVGLSVAIVTLAAGLGVSIYGDYRDRLRQSIFQHAKVVGYLFERKEHLAFGAVLLAYAGAVAYAVATRVEGDARDRLRKAAHWSFVAAAAMAVVTAALGTVIAAYKTF